MVHYFLILKLKYIVWKIIIQKSLKSSAGLRVKKILIGLRFPLVQYIKLLFCILFWFCNTQSIWFWKPHFPFSVNSSWKRFRLVWDLQWDNISSLCASNWAPSRQNWMWTLCEEQVQVWAHHHHHNNSLEIIAMYIFFWNLKAVPLHQTCFIFLSFFLQ